MLDILDEINILLFEHGRRLGHHKECIRGDKAIASVPCLGHLQYNPVSLSMRGFFRVQFKILLDCLLLVGTLHNFQENHYARGHISKILYLTTIVGLAIHWDAVWQANDDLVAAMPKPRDH